MSTKSKSILSETPKKPTPAAPRASKVIKAVAKCDPDPASPLHYSRIDKSSKITSKPSVEKEPPKLSTPPDKKPTRILKPSELQTEPNVAQEDLKKAKEKLILIEREKAQALQQVKEFQSLADEANEKLKKALMAQKEAEENFRIEKLRAVETGQAGIEAAQKKEDEWKKELEDMAKKVKSLMSNLETVKEEKNLAIEKEKIAEDSVRMLLEEKNKRKNDLEALRKEEDKSKKAIASLESALHEASSEATEAKERFLVSQAENKQCETRIEDLKLVVEATNEKYENLLSEAKEKTDEHQKLMAKWEEKEQHLISCVNRTEDENSSMENKVRDIIKENEELRIREAALLKKVEELSKLLEEALAKKEAEENGELSDSEKDYDMLPKVVEFSEENGGGGTPKVNITLHDEAVDHTSTEDESLNEKLNEYENKEKDDVSAKGELKMWESCKIEDEDFSPEREAKQGGESKADVVAEKIENGSTSPIKQESQKKKRPLLYKFGSLLKKKSISSQK